MWYWSTHHGCALGVSFGGAVSGGYNRLVERRRDAGYPWRKGIHSPPSRAPAFPD